MFLSFTCSPKDVLPDVLWTDRLYLIPALINHVCVLMFCRNSKLTHLLQDSLGMIFLGVLLYNSEIYNCISEFWHGNLLAIPKTHLVEIVGGDSKTLMFVQISPYEGDVGETLCSLNFASRVRGIELGPARKQLDTGELFKYKQLVCLFDLLFKRHSLVLAYRVHPLLNSCLACRQREQSKMVGQKRKL